MFSDAHIVSVKYNYYIYESEFYNDKFKFKS